MKHCIVALFLIISFSSVAQDSLPTKSATYKEDQWYASLSFLFANESIQDFRFNGISQAFSVGFIRDIPLNADSNRALGFGLGYGISNYGSNLTLIEETGSPYEFNLIENTLLYHIFLKYLLSIVGEPLPLRPIPFGGFIQDMCFGIISFLRRDPLLAIQPAYPKSILLHTP
jgi:hypothetical protein